jgi:superfamily II DNA or RNA helicase
VSAVHVLDIPFAMRPVATAHAARWDASRGVFIYEGKVLPQELSPFRALSYSWEMHVQRELVPAKRAARPPAATIKLRAHQEAAVRAIAAARAAKLPGFLLADDVGLGKTISAWAAILEMADVESVLIVCPLSVVAHWRRTIEAMGDGGKDIVVLNYDRLGKLFEVSDAARKKIRTKKGLARAGTAPELDLIVFDESHRCKNPTAARSKLAAKLVANAGFCL